MLRLILALSLTTLLLGLCGTKPKTDETGLGLTGPPEPKNIEDLRRITVEDGLEVTFYPTYGFRSGDQWVIPTRTWVHEDRRLVGRVLANIAERKFKCTGPEIETMKMRLSDFPDDDESREKVIIEFDSDPEQEKFVLGESNRNGLIQFELRIADAKIKRLLEQQGARQWLKYHAVSGGHNAKGRIRLIEPSGVSVVTDIDDTIKVTGVPAEKSILLTNTFCREFVAAPGMTDMYLAYGDATFHYVSGGPWQLFGPLYDYLITGAGKYPEGSFHFSEFPKNLSERETIESLLNLLEGSLQKTYDHKVTQVSNLIEQFPARKFILVGDSGELDPEVYRKIKETFPDRVQEIWIRDVVNDAAVNPDRLKGMNPIKVEPMICASAKHHKKLAKMIKELTGFTYVINEQPPCNNRPADDSN